MIKYQCCYLSLNYLLTDQGMVDVFFMCSNNQFIGTPHNYNSIFFADNQAINRNLVLLFQKQNNNLFSI
jgi:hypothetical protein